MLRQVRKLGLCFRLEPQITVDQRQSGTPGARGAVLADKVPYHRGNFCQPSLCAAQGKHLDTKHPIGVLRLCLLPWSCLRGQLLGLGEAAVQK